MDYYQRVARATQDLETWIINDKRKPWNEFCRYTLKTYGFNKTKMLKTLKEIQPKLTIKDELLVKT